MYLDKVFDNVGNMEGLSMMKDKVKFGLFYKDTKGGKQSVRKLDTGFILSTHGLQ